MSTVPLCGGVQVLGEALALLFMILAVAATGFIAAIVALVNVLRRFPRAALAPKPSLKLVCGPARVEVRWPWPRLARLTADDGGLRVTAPLRKPLVLDADDIQRVCIDPRGGTRHVLVVETRDGRSQPCGRTAHYADLERVREALSRALRLAPHDRFTSTVSMA